MSSRPSSASAMIATETIGFVIEAIRKTASGAIAFRALRC